MTHNFLTLVLVGRLTKFLQFWKVQDVSRTSGLLAGYGFQKDCTSASTLHLSFYFIMNSFFSFSSYPLLPSTLSDYAFFSAFSDLDMS